MSGTTGVDAGRARFADRKARTAAQADGLKAGRDRYEAGPGKIRPTREV